MYELVQVSEECYYINCLAKIGVYLVDSGNDKDAGRKIRKILDKNGWHLAAILNTHSNADHIGRNRYLQLDKYAVSVIYDVGAYLETLDKVEQMEAVIFVPTQVALNNK